jgi:hypothetical protein
MDNINKNFERNKSRFIEGVHYFLLKGVDLKAFKNCPTISRLVQIGKRSASLYLWTERGTVRHAKILDTDNAWAVQDRLEDFYFTKNQPKRNGLVDLPASKPLPNALSEILSANLTPVKKMVMLNIVNKADKNGQFQMGVLDLAHLCGIAKSTIIETVSSLEQLGFLTIMRTRASNGGSNPNLYTIPERFRFVSGELVDEPIAIEYQPPKGMMLIAESEFEALQKDPAPVVQKVEPIAAGCVVIPIKEYDKSKQLNDILESLRFQLRTAGFI